LVVDIVITCAIVAGLGIVAEDLIVSRIRSVCGNQNGLTRPVPAARVFAYSSLTFFVAGILLPFCIYDDLQPVPSLGLWVVAQGLAIVFGGLGWREKVAKVTVILALLAVVLPLLTYMLFGVHAEKVPI